MIHYSVLIPVRDCAADLAQQVPRLCAELRRLALPFEVLVIDHGSHAEALRQIEQLAASNPPLRVLRLDEPAGASVALSAGIAAARGRVLVAIEAGQRYPVDQIANLVAGLSRLDLVFARRRLYGWRKLWHRVRRIPRGLLLGLDVRHPECLFWAARREAVADIAIAPGMRRYLPWLVAGRGYRVGDIYVKENPCRSTLHDPAPNPLDLLTAWWTCRRWRSDAAHEMEPAASSGLRLAATEHRAASEPANPAFAPTLLPARKHA